MKKTYWVIKNSASTAEWVEMTGEQFYEFVKSPAGKGRYFMDCDTYKIEVSLEQYKKWKLETNHSNYLQSFEDEVLILSLDSIVEDNSISNYDVIDLSVNIEDEVINKIDLQLLSEAILSLTDDEQWLITELYLRGKPKTEQEIAESIGISQPAIHKRKNKILKKIKMLVIKS